MRYYLFIPGVVLAIALSSGAGGAPRSALSGGGLDIESYCSLRLFFDLSNLAYLSQRNLPEAGCFSINNLL